MTFPVIKSSLRIPSTKIEHRVDFTDRVLGNVHILRKSETSRYWHCQCLLCNKPFDAKTEEINRGVPSRIGCGCGYRKVEMKLIRKK